ncbi:MAG: hypothetical protein ACO1TE_07475, partial [Prosthecobacter sp.]
GGQAAAAEPQVGEPFEHTSSHPGHHEEQEQGHWHSEQEHTAPGAGGADDVPTATFNPGAYEEPPSQDLAPEEQDGHALWQEFMRQDQPQTAGEGDLSAVRDLPAVKTEPEPVSKAPARAASEEPGPAPKKTSKVEANVAEKPMPVPRAPEVLSLRTERDKRRPADTPPVSLGGTPKAEKGEKDKPKAEDPEAAGSGDAAEPTPKPFMAPKPPPEEPLHPDMEKKVRWRKLVEKAGFRSLGWSVIAHLIILSLAGVVGFNQVVDSQVDFLPGGGSAQSESAAAELTHKMQQKKNPWLKSKPLMQKVTVQSITADIVLPEMPMDVLDLSSITDRMDIKAAGLGAGAPMGMGAGGAGGGFGSGIGRGGKFSFVGQTALGKRVVFVVDVSGSMSAVGSGESISRFDLLKKELAKSVTQMPMNTQYQILFFSDFAWPHDQVDSRDVNALSKYRWDITPETYKKVKLPTFRFIQATPFSLRETADIIQRSDNPGGTNWGSGLLMALNANPKPDVIFFMTDGLRSDEQGWVDIVTAENKRRLPMTAIYTSAMQQPDAARELDDLARRNNGRFTVVLGDGKIVKGEDFFKMKK